MVFELPGVLRSDLLPVGQYGEKTVREHPATHGRVGDGLFVSKFSVGNGGFRSSRTGVGLLSFPVTDDGYSFLPKLKDGCHMLCVIVVL